MNRFDFIISVFIVCYTLATSLILWLIRGILLSAGLAGGWLVLVFPVIIVVASFILIWYVEGIGKDTDYSYLSLGKKKKYEEEQDE